MLIPRPAHRSPWGHAGQWFFRNEFLAHPLNGLPLVVTDVPVELVYPPWCSFAILPDHLGGKRQVTVLDQRRLALAAQDETQELLDSGVHRFALRLVHHRVIPLFGGEEPSAWAEME